MSHLKFNIPHLDLPMVGCLQGPSVPDGGVGSARRGREALQWRTSRGIIAGLIGGDVLSHANCPRKRAGEVILNSKSQNRAL